MLEGLEHVSGKSIEVIHIVGGGSKNTVLNQLVADATQRTVIAGPSEATAIGNTLVQAIGAGEISGLPELRAVVSASFALKEYRPGPRAGWEDAYRRFLSIKEG